MIRKISEIAVINAEQKKYKGIYDTIQYLDTANVKKGIFICFQELKVGNDNIPSRAQRAVKDGTTIISSVRPNLKHFGYFENPDDNVVVSSGFVTVDPISSVVDSKFLYYVLTSPETTSYLTRIASTAVSTYPSFNPEDIENFYVDIPESL